MTLGNRIGGKRGGLVAAVAALCAGTAQADMLTFGAQCDNVWQTCCDGPDNTKINNWGRSSPAPVCPALPTGADELTIFGDCIVGPSPAPTVACLTLDQSGGTFTLNHGMGVGQEAHFDGPFVWNAGDLGRSGGAAGQFAEMNGGLSIVGDANRVLSYFGGFRLINRAEGVWSGNGNLTIGMIPGGCCPSVLENAAGATFTVLNSASILATEYGTGVFENAGTLIKSSVGTSSWAVNLLNSGLVHVQSGELKLTRGGVIGGQWQIEPGAQVSFAGANSELDPGVDIQGRAVVMSSGNGNGIVVNDDVTINDLTVADDGRVGGTGILRVAGTLGVEGGDLPVHMHILPSGRLDASLIANYLGQIDLEGEVRIASGAQAGCFNQRLNILPGGELILENNALYNQTGLGTQPIENYGVIRKVAGGGTARIANFFNTNLNLHPGSQVQCPDGVLRIENRIDTNGGSFNIGAGAEIAIAGWTLWHPGTTVTGDGFLHFDHVQNNNIDDGFELVVPRLRVSGTTNSGHGVNGPGTLRVTEEFDLRGGWIGVPLATIDPGATMSLTGPDFAGSYNVVFENHGRTNIVAQSLGFKAFNNRQDGIVDLQADFAFLAWFGTGPFLNEGLFAKTGGSGFSHVAVSLVNTGRVRAESGQIVFNNPSYTFTQNAGGDTELAGGEIVVASMTLNGGDLRGAGTVRANIVNNGAAVEPGASPGIMSVGSHAAEPTVAGNYTQAAGGTLRIELGGLTAGTQHDQLAVTGAANLGGTLELVPINGFAPQVGQQFTILTRASGAGQFASVVGVGGGSYSVAYNPTSVVVTVTQAPCPGDVDGDGAVALSDLTVLLSAFGTTSGATYADGDLDADGDVDLTDLTVLLSRFGTICS